MISAKDLKEQSTSLNVLYAEDEAMLRDSMKMTLEKLFGKVFVANNGQEAFEIYKKEDIDIIITDINMPIMSGIELIHSVHTHLKEEPFIVVLSAHDESKLLIKLINMGITNFLNKPLDKQMMITILYKICKIINDKKLLVEYEVKLENEIEAMARKNKILEQKLKQLAAQTNKNVAINGLKNATLFNKKNENSSLNTNYFETLLVEDKDELNDLSIELDNFITMMFQGNAFNEKYLERLSEVYRKYASILNSYPEFFDIASFLQEFSHAILALSSKFMQDINQTGIYFESLQLALENYRKNVWNKEAKDPKFYNASLINDIQLIIDFLKEKEIQENEIEFF